MTITAIIKKVEKATIMFVAVIPNKVRNLLCEYKLYASKKGSNQEILRSAHMKAAKAISNKILRSDSNRRAKRS